MLIPLSRRSETYHALADAGKSLEHVFRHWRDRYRVAGNNPDTRPRRPGLAWQELRASAGCSSSGSSSAFAKAGSARTAAATPTR